MIEIDFVQLIQNALNVAGMQRDRLFRTRLSLVSPLGNALIRHTVVPAYGRRAPTTPRPLLRVAAKKDVRPRLGNVGLHFGDASSPLGNLSSPLDNASSHASNLRPHLDISGVKSIKTELDLLQEFQNLHHLLLGTKGVPSTQVPRLMLSLSRYPVISITLLAKDAHVSRDTAKRWITGLEKAGKLEAREFNGMKQYAYSEVINILDRFVRYSAIP